MNSNFVSKLPFWILAFVLSSGVHECAHAWAAYKLGDDTAKRQGRITLNPIAHVSLSGLILLIVILSVTQGKFGFGWAKPVPFNEKLLRNPKRDIGLLSLAGPASNIILSIVIAAIFSVLRPLIGDNEFVVRSFGVFIVMNIILAGFNLAPLPPLDGSKLLFTLIPIRWLNVYKILYRYGTGILLVLLFTGIGEIVFAIFMIPIWLMLMAMFCLPIQMFDIF